MLDVAGYMTPDGIRRIRLAAPVAADKIAVPGRSFASHLFSCAVQVVPTRVGAAGTAADGINKVQRLGNRIADHTV
jgi:hypothetical protein